MYGSWKHIGFFWAGCLLSGALIAQTAVNISMQAATEYFNQGSYLKADSLLQQVLTEAPENDVAWRVSGKCKHKLGNLKAAKNALRRARRLNPSVENLTAWGDFKWLCRRKQAARMSWRRALRVDSLYLPALLSFGNFYEAGEKWKKAEVYFKRSVRGSPLRAEGYFQLAKSQAKMNLWGQVCLNLEYALQLGAESDELLFLLGKAQQELLRPEAFQTFSGILEKDSTHAKARLARAYCMRELLHYPAALIREELSRVLVLDSSLDSAYLLHAEVCYETQLYEAGWRSLTRLEKIAKNRTSNYLKAKLAYKLHRYKDALKAYRACTAAEKKMLLALEDFQYEHCKKAAGKL